MSEQTGERAPDPEAIERAFLDTTTYDRASEANIDQTVERILAARVEQARAADHARLREALKAPAQIGHAMKHAKNAGDQTGRILSACLADEVGREPLDRATVANLAHDAAEAATRAYLNAREAQRQVRAALDATDTSALDRLLDEARAEGAREALREARDAWQWGQWADAPRCADRVQERIANAQYVTDWLTARLEALTDEGSSS